MRSNQTPNQRGVSQRRARRNLSISVESLEGRALLSGPGYGPYPPPMSPPTMNPPPIVMPTQPPRTPPNSTPTPILAQTKPAVPISTPTPKTPAPAKPPRAVSHQHAAAQHKPTGIVTKAPHFYQFYTGPKWAELNAVKASAELSPNGAFTFTGTNQGAIKKTPAVYVWGIDRNGNLPSGPFTDRPNIKFDAVVVVSLNSTLTPTATVVDLASGTTTVLPSGSVSIHGHTVTVKVSASLLPSTGLAPSQYRFNFWPEDGGPPVSASVASFAPEFTTAQVGTSK
jgi:hypothetical protein